MNNFDSHLKKCAKEDDFEVPESVSRKIEDTLSSLPEKMVKPRKKSYTASIIGMAACLALVFLVVLPNCSSAYAKALENVPVLNRIVDVVTIMNYSYRDDNHELDINVPSVEGTSTAENFINKSVDELTTILADKFEDELELYGDEVRSSIYVDYDVVTNNDNWFTLKIRVNELTATSNIYFKYYHIDKISGQIVELSDLAEDNSFYSKLNAEIKRQMEAEMAADSEKTYWLDGDESGNDYIVQGENHNFYWAKNGDMVIVFDKYEVSPGYMGTPEFAISKSILGESLSAKYR